MMRNTQVEPKLDLLKVCFRDGKNLRFHQLAPQAGHILSVGVTIAASLHFGHLPGWTLTRLISSGSRWLLITALFNQDSYVVSVFR